MSTTPAVGAFSDEDEARHAPGQDMWWQESIAFHWYDARSGAGGVHRIGHEPNFDGGVIAHHFGVFTPTHRFRRAEVVPASQACDSRWFGDRAHSFEAGRGTGRLRVAEPECQLELEMEPLYPRTDFFPRDAGSEALNDEFAPHHYECSGRVRGTLSLGPDTLRIDGYCHRDHSWGLRRWDTLVSHRWVSGVLEDGTAFGSVVWHAVDDSLVRGGYLVRDGRVEITPAVDVVASFEVDGTSVRGGKLVLDLRGERFEVSCRAVDALLNDHHGVVWVDTICEVADERGRRGYCDFETCNNPRRGVAPVRLVIGANTVNGITQR